MIPFAIDQLFLLDIETVSEKKSFQQLDAEWQEMWAQKIHRSLPNDISAEEYYPKRAAIFAEFARIVCISFGYFKKEKGEWNLRVKSLCFENEIEILEQFATTLAQFFAGNVQWIFSGHNIKEFDIPFLCRRMLINQVPIPKCLNFQNNKPWETPILDTLHQWRFGDYKHYISLKLLAAALGIPSPKDDIDGSQVGDVYWKEKDLNRIAVYCEKDVATVAQLILRFNEMPLLNSDQVIFVDRNKQFIK